MPSNYTLVLFLCAVVFLLVLFVFTNYCIFMLPLLSRRSRQRERLHASGLSSCSSVCLSVCLSPKYKNAILSKTKQFRAMVSIDDL